MAHRLLILLMLVACATTEVATAKRTTYAADPHQIFEIAQQAALESYKLGEVDAVGLRFTTAPQFYSATGDRESPGAGGMVQIRGGSVQVTLIVEVIETDNHRVAVRITPVTFQALSGSPKPRELKPDDPYLPPWILGRADALYSAIYDRAKPYAMAPPGGS
jgi:hypothetical protein